jgi:hypothetical protein
MANLSNYAELKVLDLLFKNTSFTAPQAYIGYFTDTITDASTPTEVSGNGYARVRIDTLMNSASSGSITNGSNITFPAANGGDHGTVVAIAIFDASSSGNMLAYGTLSASKNIQDGDQLQIAASNLTITLD